MPPQMTTSFRLKAYNQGQTIFREGQDGSFACIINSGRAAVSREVDGEPLMLAVLERGAIFGEMALLGAERRTATVTALEYTEVVIVNRDRLQASLESSNPMMQALISALIERLASTSAMVSRRLDHADQIKGLANLLQVWTEAADVDQDGRVHLPMNKLVSRVKATMKIPAPQLEEVLGFLAETDLMDIRRTRLGREIILEKPTQFLRKASVVAGKVARREKRNEAEIPAPEQPAEREQYIDLFDLAREAELEPADIRQAISRGDLPETMLCFRRGQALEWARAAGRKLGAAPEPEGRPAPQSPSALEGLLETDPPILKRALKAVGLDLVETLLAGASEGASRIILDNYDPGMAKELMAFRERSSPPEPAVLQGAVRVLGDQIRKLQGM